MDRNKSGGGIITYIKQTLSPTEVDFLQEKFIKLGLEVTITRIATRSIRNITIVGVYRPPNALKEWFLHFNALLQEIAPWGPKITMGDLNADLVNPLITPGKNLLESLALINTEVVDIFATRTTDHSATCLDIIAVDCSIECLHYAPVNCAASDHSPVIAEINLASCSSVLKPILKRNYKHVNEVEFHQDLSRIVLPSSGLEDVNHLLDSWYSQFNDILNKHAPYKSFPFKKNYLPWISDSTKETMHQRDVVARKLKASVKSGGDLSTITEELKLLRKRVKGQLKYDLKHFGDETIRSNDHKKIWHFIRNSSFTATKGQCSRIDPFLLNDHFSSTVTHPTDCVTQSIQQADMADAFQMVPVSTSDVISLLHGIKLGSAAGHDGITGRTLKTYAVSLAPSLTVLLNASISQSVFPEEWKKANVVPIWKSKGSKSDPSNYRPISIIPVMGKILEKIVVKQLNTHCNDHNIIPVEQFGFREKSSVELTLLSATEVWLEAIDKGQLVGTLLIDLAKAFDTVSHQQLLLELSSIHCGTNALTWFRSFLTNRQQRVKQESTLTPWKPVTRGVPQGSCLSPLLFNILVRELPRSVNARMWQFADDITESVFSASSEKIKEELAKAYHSTKSFCSSKQLDINLSKIQFIIFKSPSKKLPDDFLYKSTHRRFRLFFRSKFLESPRTGT